LKRSELIVDSFAGGGGASTGIEMALGRSPDIAINHNPAAIAMHKANHPRTKHYAEDVFQVVPRVVTKGKKVGLLWASPDCRHFSRAKGSKPVEKSIRGLAWVVIKWAVEVKPRVIILENVREFQEWGPVVPRWACRVCDWKGTEGQAVLIRKRPTCPRCETRRINPTEDLVPCPDRKGLTFRKFTGRLRNLGYKVEHRVLNAADFGAPTHRRRLFLVARCDGLPVEWPAPTHGDPKKIHERDLFSEPLQPWRTAAECIDWSIHCPSIFSRKKPLADKTLRRIALGIKRYVLDNPKPFIVDMQRENKPRDIDEPMGTATGQTNRFNLVTPIIVPLTHSGERRSNSVKEPFPTITSAHRGEHALVTPFLAPQYGRSAAASVESPCPTVTAGGMGKQVLVAPVLSHIGHGEGKSGPNEVRASSVEQPIGTVTAGGQNYALVAATLIQSGYGERQGQSPRVLDIKEPLGTVVGTSKHAVVSAFLAKHFGGVVGCEVDTPLPTTTARGTQTQIVAANLVHMNHGGKQSSGCEEPMRTVTAGGGHAALVYSFLVKYFGTAIGQKIDGPLHTITGKDRAGLVTVTIDGEPYVITDIGMRMLKPRELARAQGFPDSYLLTGSATSQVERIGNSVSPQPACALAKANCATVKAGAA
jgi:DNA (cytosine-5)-methyltransferase 1